MIHRRAIGLAAVALALTTGLAIPAPQRNAAPAARYGDVNGDGAVTIADAIFTLKIALGLEFDTVTSDQYVRADVAPYPGADGRTIGDTSVDVADATRTLQFAVGLIADADYRPPVGSVVSFHNDIAPILQNTCESFLCHGGRLPKGNMKLVAGEEYHALVGVPSDEAPDVLRVKPGDPDHSYMYAKLTGQQEALGGSGDRMPAGEALIAPPLPDDEIALIRTWIEEGAPDN